MIRWREHERGDVLLALPTANVIAAAQKNLPVHAAEIADNSVPLPLLAKKIGDSDDEIKEIALVKDGIADPDHLTIGGYSYGGYI